MITFDKCQYIDLCKSTSIHRIDLGYRSIINLSIFVTSVLKCYYFGKVGRLPINELTWHVVHIMDFLCFCTALAMQPSQKVWPHGLAVVALTRTPRQSEQLRPSTIWSVEASGPAASPGACQANTRQIPPSQRSYNIGAQPRRISHPRMV